MAAESTLSNPLDFTGERFTPECVREIWYEHIHRYAFARELVSGLNVLDAACGEGYGTALLATRAASATGVDVSAQAVQHAQARYTADNLEFRASDCLALPFEDGTFDCVVSFETLEHLEDHQGLMKEFRRVLKPAGFLVVSSPDKAVYTDQLHNDNEHHVRELYRDEFESLLGCYFPAFRMLGQKLLFQSAIWRLTGGSGVICQQDNRGEVATFPTPHHDPVYLIAICANDESSLPRYETGLNLFDDAGQSVYAHYNDEIRKHIAAGELLAVQEAELKALRTELKKAQAGQGWWSRWFKRS